MMIPYHDTATFVRVESTGYGNDKIAVGQDDVAVTFLQNTGFSHGQFRDGITSDAICYPDPDSEFIANNGNRLEGMYVLAPMFDVDNDQGWYKITSVNVNRDHLLGNRVDNIECLLTKSVRVPNVS